jgi:hypothetical protein
MEFEREDDDLFDVEITEQGPKPRVQRTKTAWEKQAETWAGPEHAFTCCGTVYRAMTAKDLALTRMVHERDVHSRTPRAPLALGQEV